jgi:hypothetical protein
MTLRHFPCKNPNISLIRDIQMQLIDLQSKMNTTSVIVFIIVWLCLSIIILSCFMIVEIILNPIPDNHVVCKNNKNDIHDENDENKNRKRKHDDVSVESESDTTEENQESDGVEVSENSDENSDDYDESKKNN